MVADNFANDTAKTNARKHAIDSKTQRDINNFTYVQVPQERVVLRVEKN